MGLCGRRLLDYVAAQVDGLFPDGYKFRGNDVESAFSIALERAEYSFSHIAENGYGEGVYHLHGDNYAQFLWFFSNSLWVLSQNRPLCDKLTYLNKALNGVLCTYKVSMPKIFLWGHPVGTVLGDAFYDDYLVVMQNVTVNEANGKNGKSALKFGRGVFLGAGAKIIGGGEIGDRCSVGANVILKDPKMESGSIAFLDKGALTIKQSQKACAAQRYFKDKL